MTNKGQGTLWRPGHSGNPNGRPPGAKHLLSQDFVEALLKDFCEHGASAIEACRVGIP